MWVVYIDQSVPVCVSFKIFDNPTLSGTPIDFGDAFTSYDVDFTLKVEAKNLQPDTKYWFQFADCANPETVSPVGATRTLSSPDSKRTLPSFTHTFNLDFAFATAPADQVNGGKPLVLSVFSCSQFQAGKRIVDMQCSFTEHAFRVFQRLRRCDSQHQYRCFCTLRGLRA